jgi:multicomponent K+:H+ antiporter subunit E
MSRLLPHPVLSLSLLLVWLVLNATLSPGQIILGSALGLGLPLLTRRFWPDQPPFHRLPGLWRLFLVVNGDILKASLNVAWLTLSRPAASLQPGFFTVPLDCQDRYSQALLLGIVSITPGTISADLDAEHGLLLVHALHERDPAAAARRIKRRYERHLLEILG